MNREDKKMFLPSLLDVDEGIMEKGLRIVSDAQGDEMSKLFPEFSATERKRTDTNAPLMPEPDWPSVQVFKLILYVFLSITLDLGGR